MAKGTILKAITENFVGKEVLPNAIKWGAIGAAGMGTIEKMRGGSFFEGASRGMFLGAVGGGLYGGYSQALKTTLAHKGRAAATKRIFSK